MKQLIYTASRLSSISAIVLTPHSPIVVVSSFARISIAFVTPDGTEELVEGRCEGTLAAEPRGSGGFGYDPAFVPDEHPDRTMAELDPEEKAATSHRGKAARAFRARLGG